MADFTSSFWNWYIIVLVTLSIAGVIALVLWMASSTLKPGEKAQAMGHVWDDDLQELNNPLPKWWLNLFYITLVFGVVYLLLYPGMGSFQGLLKWTEVGQYETVMRTSVHWLRTRMRSRSASACI
jgi:cytochrome c oxidase cbb3-type subunit 3